MTISILILSIAGLLIANEIRKQKKSKNPMICPLDGNCEQVLQSKYATFTGVPLEYAGMFYYAFLTVSYVLFLIAPEFQDSLFGLIILFATIFGLIFSIYLTAIQGFVLKSWCTWCLYSAIISTTIFFGAFFSFLKEFDISNIVFINFELIKSFEMLLIAFATSTVLVTEIITFKFLKDFKISEKESNIFMILWQLVWVLIFGTIAITILFISSNYLEIILSVSSEKLLKLFFIILLSAISSFYLIPKIYKSSKHNRVCVNYIITGRILLITIGSVLISSWFFLPIDNIFIYEISAISLALGANILLQLFDQRNLKRIN
jgi:uncharacterized membrane protein